MIGFFNSFGLSREYAYKIYENFPKKIKKNVQFFNFHSIKVNRDYVSNVNSIPFPFLKQRLNELFYFPLKLPKNLDIFHFTNQGVANFLSKNRKNQILTVHDLTPFYFEKYGLLKKYFLKKIKLADKIIAISESTRKDIISILKVPEDNISVIYNGVDTDMFKPLKLKKENFILNIGTDEPRKNIKNLLILFKALQKREPNLKLVRVGGCSKASLKFINKNNLNVIFMNNLSQKNLVKLYNKAKFYITTSLYEGFGLPLVEAMACGCPVVASPINAHKEVLNGCGFLIKDGNDAENIDMCLNILNDTKKTSKTVRKGIKRAKTFSWEENAKKHAKVYNKLI